ncbi:arsenite methyltransferase [Micractinium conductrix]|uniref:Arsenite methyltransferase n=1 Tax=Micractinium conductrix TaxID=554055 RepID=A0A2P6VPS4_9CHLO|nr:arsenite methyltransferase [Micractinium conductrix]|eukprot:PSC76080.1 arsenite methyltransferase [Micractinium conductrix]
MALGFTMPLLIILGAETLVGGLLLCPAPINKPAIQLVRASYTQVGSTVFHTVAALLLLLLASPVYDGVRLWTSTKHQPEQVSQELSDQEMRTLLSLVLTTSSLALMFFLRSLGNALGKVERMCVSEAAMLKQVKGLQSEYTRMVDSGAAAGKAAAPAGGELPAGEVAEMRKLLADLEEQNSRLQARVDTANKEHAAAESNLAALKTQSKGLENEYDRLLQECDELRRQVQRAGQDRSAAVQARALQLASQLGIFDEGGTGAVLAGGSEVLSSVQRYYGEVLKTKADLKTPACCAVEPPAPAVRDLLRKRDQGPAVNLSPDKPAVLREAYRVLAPGGEKYFSDVYVDRRLPEEIRTHPVLLGECLGGAMYERDFVKVCQEAGFAAPLRLTSRAFAVSDAELAEMLGGARFSSVTYRLFKLPGGLLEEGSEDFGQAARYLGSIPGHRLEYALSEDTVLPAGKWQEVDGNTAAILQHSWLSRHFQVVGDRTNHFGPFAKTGPLAAAPAAKPSCCA